MAWPVCFYDLIHDWTLKKISGGGLTFGPPPQYLYHGYAPGSVHLVCIYMLNVYSGYTLGFFRWWERRDEHFVNYQGVFAGTHPDGPQPRTDVPSSPCPEFCHRQKNNRARSELSCSRDKRSWNWVQRLIWGGRVSQIHLWKWTLFFVVSS